MCKSNKYYLAYIQYNFLAKDVPLNFIVHILQTNKASMLEEVIKYLKQLQAQIQLISYAKNMEQQMMMMSLGMQPAHIQMPLLATMGMCSSTTGILNNMTSNLAPAPYQSLIGGRAPLIYPTSSMPTLFPPFMSPPFATASSIPSTPPQPINAESISPKLTKYAAPPNIAASTSFPFCHPYNAYLPHVSTTSSSTFRNL